MRLREVRDWLFPTAAGDENGFEQEALSVGHKGLVIYSWMLIASAVFILFARLFVLRQNLVGIEAAGIMAIGLSMLAISRTNWSFNYSRVIGMLGALLSCLLAVTATMWMAKSFDRLEDFVPLQVSFLVLSLVAFVPVLPLHIFLVTLTVLLYYLAWPGTPFAMDVLFLSFLVLLSTALAAVLYRQRRTNFSVFVKTLQATAGLGEVQTKLLLSEHVATLGRLSAAIGHELNSPLGALKSSVDTLLLLSARMATGEGNPERMVRLQADLRRSIQESTRRLSEIVARMQRFSNLDRAEVQEADLNELLKDVVALAESESGCAGRFQLNLGPMKPLLCRPAQISAAFHSIVSNAAGAITGEGRVEIRSGANGTTREVVIADDGRGIPPDVMPGLFDPSLKSAHGRVQAGNWSMFSARQIIREHGGDIEVRSATGHGTIVRITLPA